MPFHILMIISAVISTALAITLGFFPSLIYWMFSIEAAESADFLARRAACLFLGLAILFGSARTITHQQTQKIIASVIVLTMAPMALLGMFEFARGFAGPGIFIAVCVEAALVMFAIKFAKMKVAA